MHTKLLEIAYKKGLIGSYSKQNAEKLDFESKSFDYVLIKETLHHLPRPWLAIYEAYRVCKKGVIIIEPNDSYHFGNISKKIFIKSKNVLKHLLKKTFYIDEYNFESVGNFIYTINKRELEKFLLGMHNTSIAFNNINDHHFHNIEHVSIKSKTFKDKITCLKLRLIILIKDLLSILGFLEYSVGEVILFKKEPSHETISDMKKFKWKFKRLPKNPYL
jgi:ubiquinone/menaquinone biosynthesis C-methylase UbiE